MKIRKLLVVVLTLSMAFSVAACSKANTGKYKKFFEDNDFEEMEYKKYKKIDLSDNEDVDPCYFASSESEEIEKYIDNFTVDFIDPNNINSVFSAKSYDFLLDEKDDAVGLKMFSAIVLTFDDEDDAAFVYKRYCKNWDKDKGENDHAKNYDTDSDDDYFVFTSERELGGYYLNGNQLIVLVVAGIDFYYDDDEEVDFDDYIDIAEDFCEEFELINPNDA